MLNGDGEPAGLPKSGGSIGSLTNLPAFTSIARIAVLIGWKSRRRFLSKVDGLSILN
jgi:hypothetical protein